MLGQPTLKPEGPLSIAAFGSVIWIVVVLGVVFPRFATFLLAFIPIPKWFDTGLVRLVMLAAALLLPLLIGFISLRLQDQPDRPQGGLATAKALLKGYPYTLGLALTLILMTIFAPVLKIRNLARRWTDEHVPVIVEARSYREVVDGIQRALEGRGMWLARRNASWMLRLPTRILTALAGGAIENLVADELTSLHSNDLEVLLHPSDIVLSGRETVVSRARAVIAEELAFSKAYLTWHKEANAMEDRLRALWEKFRTPPTAGQMRQAEGGLKAIEHDLRRLEIPYEEWETLFRLQLLVERAVLRGVVPPSEAGHEPPDVPARAVGTNGYRSAEAAVLAGIAILAGCSTAAVLHRMQGDRMHHVAGFPLDEARRAVQRVRQSGSRVGRAIARLMEWIR